MTLGSASESRKLESAPRTLRHGGCSQRQHEGDFRRESRGTDCLDVRLWRAPRHLRTGEDEAALIRREAVTSVVGPLVGLKALQDVNHASTIGQGAPATTAVLIECLIASIVLAGVVNIGDRASNRF